MAADTTAGTTAQAAPARKPAAILAVANWSMLLWVFAGLSALCLLSGAVILRDIAHLTHPRLDAASVALIGIALIGILYGVSTVFSGSAPMAAVADQVPAFKSAWSFVVERENADFDRTLRETMAAPVSSIATKSVICVNVNDDMGKVARVLSEHHLKKAPVLDGDVMVGIINRSNITGYAVRRYLSEQRA
ncbi:CBS domain-containing protein [Adlercreutzia shanghongiae]|uniref:CBS domain-containing protein n=1 Tax=Adlercreutzia shanghongiae TaxID=3111773 RepID=A0ABU6IVR8_9ACTN|nr:CBS domain-containing protein [Adlercreutzia sp. R22]MEC4293928.1 CBS domain-containing protein [Adlercreutzia sp. R22]